MIPIIVEVINGTKNGTRNSNAFNPTKRLNLLEATSKMHRTLTAALFICNPYFAAAWPQPPRRPAGARELFVTAGKSIIVDSPVPIQRVSVANDAIAQAVATSPREVLINGKAPGETLVIWQQNGQRQFFDVAVTPRNRLETVRHELSEELNGQNVTITQGDTVFHRDRP